MASVVVNAQATFSRVRPWGMRGFAVTYISSS